MLPPNHRTANESAGVNCCSESERDDDDNDDNTKKRRANKQTERGPRLRNASEQRKDTHSVASPTSEQPRRRPRGRSSKKQTCTLHTLNQQQLNLFIETKISITNEFRVCTGTFGVEESGSCIQDRVTINRPPRLASSVKYSTKQLRCTDDTLRQLV